MENLGHPKVMIVDDDQDLLQLMKATLQREGFHVDARSEPPNWIELKEAHPAMIFMDVDLQHANGARACKAIKESFNNGGLPIILISGHGQDQLRNEAKVSHADGFLSKPFARHMLVELAERHARNAA